MGETVYHLNGSNSGAKELWLELHFTSPPTSLEVKIIEVILKLLSIPKYLQLDHEDDSIVESLSANVYGIHLKFGAHPETGESMYNKTLKVTE